MNPMKSTRGLFIPIEGIDGSGKTTVAAAASEILNKKGCPTLFLNKKDTSFFDQPYSKRFMNNLSASLWGANPNDPVGSVSEIVWLYLHSAWYHMMQSHVIKPMLSSCRIVIMDGWYYKFLGRHLENGHFDFEHSQRVLSDLEMGDPVILLDISPEVVWERRQEFKESELGAHSGANLDNNPKDRFIGYQTSVRNRLLNMSEAPNWKVIQANDSLGNIVENVVDIVTSAYYSQ